MPLGLLFLPLLAGYLFIHLCVGTYYRAKALEKYRLLFEAAGTGAFFFFVARMVVLAAKPLLPGIGEWHRAFPQPYLGTAIASILVSIAAAFGYNYLYGLDWEDLKAGWQRYGLRQMSTLFRARLESNTNLALRQAFEKEGDSLIWLLYSAATTNTPVAVTLASRKWYVGAVARLPNLEVNEKYFHLLPYLSSHRDKDSLEVELSSVVDYRPVYANKKRTDFVVILPLADVRDARLYDPELGAESFGREPFRSEAGEPTNPPATAPAGDLPSLE